MKLVGSEIAESTQIQSLIDTLVQEAGRLNAGLQEVRGPRDEYVEQARKFMERTAQLRGRPLHYPYVGSGAGNGVFVELEDGSVKIDLINGIGIHLFGHGHPRIMAAQLRGALSDVVMQGNLQPNREYTLMTEKLVALAGRRSRLRHAWLSTCGTMANENALKMARQKLSPARMIIAFKNAFAGRSTMMAEVTDNPAFKQGLPDYNEVLRIPFFDHRDPASAEKTLNALKEHCARHENNICTFVFEPMLGEGGYRPAPREFFIPLLEFCRAKKIAVWADEVQTFARTGQLFAFETLDFGDYVDLVTIAKTVQIGATLYTEEYNPKPGLVSGTFSGGTTSLTAGLEILEMLTEEGYLGAEGRVAKIHRRFVDGLNRLNEGSCKGKVVDAGGMGLMVAFTPFDGQAEQVASFLKKLFHNGVIGFSCGKAPTVRARFLIPACIKDGEIDAALAIIEKTIQEGP